MKTISFLGLCFLTTSIAVSQNKLSLQDAVTNALASRSEYKRAQLEKAIAQQRIGDSHLKYAPDLRGEFNLQFNSIIPTSIIPIGQLNPQTPTNEVRAVQFGQPWSNSAGVVARQIIFDPSVTNELKENRLQLALADANLNTTRENVIYVVTKAYYNALLAQAELDFALSDTVRAYEQFRTVLQRFIEKQITAVEKKQAELSLADSRFNAFKMQSRLKTAMSSLKFASGLPDEMPVALTTDLNATLQSLPTDELTILVGQWSEYKRKKIERDLSIQKVTSLKASSLLPSVQANAFLGANQFSRNFEIGNMNGWYGNSYVNVTAQVPLSAFYRQSKKLEQAKAQMQQSALALEEIEKQFSFETSVAKRNLSTSLEEYQNQQARLELSKDIYKNMVSSFEAGRSLFSQVQDAETSVKQAQLNVLSSIYSVLISQIEFQRLTGFLQVPASN